MIFSRFSLIGASSAAGAEDRAAVRLFAKDLVLLHPPAVYDFRRSGTLFGPISDVIPISGKTGENIGQELIPAIIETSPEAALALGRMLPQYRREAADRIVRHATLFNLVAGMEPIPLIDIPVLLSTQIRMVFRVAALYNEPLGSRPTRELIVTIGGGLFFRYLAEEAAKAMPFGGDLVSGAIAGAGTWALGHVAIEYFEGGKQLTAAQLRELFARFYRRYREENPEAGRASVTPARDVVVAGEG